LQSGGDLVKQAFDDLVVAQLGNGKAAGMDLLLGVPLRAVLGKRDQRSASPRMAAAFGFGGLDPLMRKNCLIRLRRRAIRAPFVRPNL
jgi:hypothetical protein